jgi:hypothetical protein
MKRAEVVALLFNGSDIAVTLTKIERLLGEDEPSRFFLEILESAERTPGAPRKPSQSVDEHLDRPPFVRFVFHSERTDLADEVPGLRDLPRRRLAKDLE